MSQTTTIKVGESAKTITLPEGKSLVITGSAGAVGVAYLLDPTLGGTNSLKSWAVGVGALAPIGPYLNTQKVRVHCSAGSIDATVQEAVLAIAGGGAADFSTTIPLSGSTTMTKQAVGGPIAFVPAADAKPGASCIAILIADGVNAPTFTGGFAAADAEWASSLGYVNIAGYTNVIQFWYDGVGYRYSISQPATQVVSDTTAPTATAAAVANATPTIVAVTMSEALDAANVPEASAFTVSGHAVSAVAISGAVVNLTVSTPFVNGEAARTLAYTQPGANGLRDAAGNLAVSFTGRAITNNVAAADTTAPVIQSASINGATLTMTYNETLTSNNPTPAAFALVLDGGAAVAPTSAVASGTNVVLTFAAAVTAGQVATLGYTPGAVAIKDAAGNSAASLVGQAVTNGTPSAGATAGRLTSLLRMTEAGSAAPYTYTGTGGEFSGSNGVDGEGRLTVAFQNGVDGSVTMQALTTPVATTGPETLLSVDASNASGMRYGTMDYALVNHPAGYSTFTNGAAGPASAVLGAANDYQRVSRVGSSLLFDVSKDGGATWTNIRSFTGVSTGVLYVFVRTAFAAQFTNLTTTGLA
jgi:hypothetical protein